MPGWVTEASNTYLHRLPSEYHVTLVEIAQAVSSTSSSERIKSEGRALLQKIKPDDTVIALEVKGQSWSTEELSRKLERWKNNSERVTFLVGGPDGLSAECLARCKQQWSLSALTLPHPMVRVILAEQIYRAHTILSNHPYHRA